MALNAECDSVCHNSALLRVLFPRQDVVSVHLHTADSAMLAGGIIAQQHLRRPLLLNLGIALRSARLRFWITARMLFAVVPFLPNLSARDGTKLARCGIAPKFAPALLTRPAPLRPPPPSVVFAFARQSLVHIPARIAAQLGVDPCRNRIKFLTTNHTLPSHRDPQLTTRPPLYQIIT